MNAFLKILLASAAGAALNGGAQAVQGGVDLTRPTGWQQVGAGAAVAGLTTVLALLLQSPLAKKPEPLVSPSEMDKQQPRQ